MLQRTITQWISVAAVVGTASKAITYFNQESTRARESFGKLAEERRRLVQISVDASDLQKMEALADQVAVEEGVEREITRRVLFSARSEGFEDFFREIIASARVIAPESAAQAAGQVPALFPKA
jgi:aspartate carbamoyltransferase catalytic subunit